MKTDGGKIREHDANSSNKTHSENGENYQANESDHKIQELEANEANKNSEEVFQQQQIKSGEEYVLFTLHDLFVAFSTLYTTKFVTSLFLLIISIVLTSV